MTERVEAFVRQLLADDVVGKQIVTESLRDESPAPHLFDFHDIEAICRFSPAHHEWAVRLSFFGENLDRAAYLDARGFYDFAKIVEFHRGGATVIANQTHQFCGKVYDLKVRLERLLHCFVNFNCYATPVRCQGLAAHVDSHDVLIVQLEGQKHWELFERAPLVAGEYTMDGFEQHEPSSRRTLSPGDLLYMPTGFVHAGKSVADTASIHLTGGFEPLSWRALLTAWLDAAARADGALGAVVPAALLRNGEAGAELERLASDALRRVERSPIAEVRRWIVEGGLLESHAVLEPADAGLTYASLSPDTELCTSSRARGIAVPGAFVLRDIGNRRTLHLKPELAEAWREIERRSTLRPRDLEGRVEACKESLFCYYLLSNGFLANADSPGSTEPAVG